MAEQDNRPPLVIALLNDSLAKLAVLAAVGWAIVAIPAYMVAGERGLVGSLIAMGTCTVPAAATMVFCRWASRRSNWWSVVGMVAGMFVRIAFVLGMGALLTKAVAWFDLRSLLIWLMIFYLITLAAEVRLLVQDIQLKSRSSDKDCGGNRSGQVASSKSVD